MANNKIDDLLGKVAAKEINQDEAMLIIQQWLDAGENIVVDPAVFNHNNPKMALSANGAVKLKQLFIEAFFKELKSVLKVDANDNEYEINLDVPIVDYGFDSISSSELMSKIKNTYKIDISPLLLFECATLGELVDKLFNIHHDKIKFYFENTSPIIDEKFNNHVLSLSEKKPAVNSVVNSKEKTFDALWMQMENEVEQELDTSTTSMALKNMTSIIITHQQEKSEFLCAGKGQPLLLVGGLGASAAIWEKQLPYFIENYQVIIYYPPGHGSTTFYKDMTLQSIAKHLYEGLTLLNVDLPLIATGWSLGGSIIQMLATQYPQTVSSIVIISSPHQIATTVSFKDIQNELNKAKNFSPDLLSFYNEKIVKYYKEIFDSADVNVNINAQSHCLIVYGGEDTYIKPEQTLALKTVIPHALVSEIKDAGHYLLLTHASDFENEFKYFMLKNNGMLKVVEG